MVTPMNTRRAGAGVAELGGRLYIVGKLQVYGVLQLVINATVHHTSDK